MIIEHFYRLGSFISESELMNVLIYLHTHSGLKGSYKKIDLLFHSFKLFIEYIYMTKKIFIGLGGRILSQNSIFYTKVDP